MRKSAWPWIVILLLLANLCSAQGPLVAQETSRDSIQAPDAVYELAYAFPIGMKDSMTWDEHGPVISPDGTTLYFLRSGHNRNLGILDEDDIWKSQLDSEGKLVRILHAGLPPNTVNEDKVVGVGSSGNTLYLKSPFTHVPGVCYQTAYRYWSKPLPVFIEGFRPNERTRYHFSTHGEKLYIVSDQEGGIGGMDFYVSERIGERGYGEPVLMDSILNTPGDELSCWLSADGMTFFFSSDGHGGEGGQDLFVSRNVDGRWMKPQSLGANINSPADDYELTVSADGNTAFFTRGENGHSKIMKIDLPEVVLPAPVTLYRAQIKYQDEEEQEIEAIQLKGRTANDPLLVPIDKHGYVQMITSSFSRPPLMLNQGSYAAICDDTSIDTSEQQDIDFSYVSVALDDHPDYRAGEEKIIRLQNRVLQLDSELLILERERRHYLDSLRRGCQKILQIDPGRQALEHRYKDAYRQDTFPLDTSSLIPEKDFPIQNTLIGAKEYETNALKERYRKAFGFSEDDGPITVPDSLPDVYVDQVNPAFSTEIPKEVYQEWDKTHYEEVRDKTLSQTTPQVREKVLADEQQLRAEIRNHLIDNSAGWTSKGLQQEEDVNARWVEQLDLPNHMVSPDVKNALKDSLSDVYRLNLEAQMKYTTKSMERLHLQQQINNSLAEQIQREETATEQVNSAKEHEPTYLEEPVYREVVTDILLYPLEAGTIIPLQGINFAPNTATFKPNAVEELEQVFNLLSDHSDIEVEIGAHTNSMLSHKMASLLSKKRADAIVKMLVEAGIDARRLRAAGYGKTVPIADNSTPEGRLKNQRIELKILAN